MNSLLSPTSIALVGVSSDTEKISGRLLPILNTYGYSGRIYPINPKRKEILGLPCYQSLLDLPEVPDVVVVLVPNIAVPEVVRQAVERQVPYVLIFSSGFNETVGEGPVIAEKLRKLVHGTNTRMMGPNSEGFYDCITGVPLSFSPVIDPARGRQRLQHGTTVVISQSGGLGFGIADQLEAAGVGIRSVVTTGNEIDLDIADFVRHYAEQSDVETIVLFVEGANDVSAWKEAFSYANVNGKTLMAIQIGTTPAGMHAVASHTGKVPRAGNEINDAFHDTSVHCFEDVDDLVDAVLGHTHKQSNVGNRVAIISVSGGGGIWCADLATQYGMRVESPSNELAKDLRSMLPTYASLTNPIDMTAQAIFDGTVPTALARILKSEDFDAILFVATLGYDHKLIDDVGFQTALKEAQKPVVVFSYTPPNTKATSFLKSIKVPCFTSPRRALRTLAAALGLEQNEEDAN